MLRLTADGTTTDYLNFVLALGFFYHWTISASPWLTATWRIFAGRLNGSSILNPRGYSGVREKKLTSSCTIGLGSGTPRISAEPS